ncbi:MAG: hypothetical protein V4717_17880 [Bacteroidota bacterium]
MKKTFILILFLSIFLVQTYGQTSKYQFAKKVFRKEYIKQEFETFNIRIEKIDKSTFRYGDKLMKVDTKDTCLMTIFSLGIFHPDVISGKHTIKTLTKPQLDTMSTKSQLFYNLSRNDTISIGDVQELEKTNPNCKTKRFVFWLYREGIANTNECYFELYNNRGTKKMRLEKYIEGSRMTFFYKGTIGI